MDNIIDLMSKMPSFVHLDGATDEEIIKAERELGTTFADDYKTYLKKFIIIFI